MLQTMCPLKEGRVCSERCELWCPGDKSCAFKLIALELLKKNERGV